MIIDERNLTMPGFKAVPDKRDVQANSFPNESKSLRLFVNFIPATYDELTNNDFCEKHGQRLFNWVVDNVPHGICEKFYEKLKKFKEGN